MSQEQTLTKHLQNRDWMVASLAGEIFGPDGNFKGWKNDLYKEAKPIKPFEGMVFKSWDDYKERHVDSETGQEILKDEPPSRRYGIGLLYPDEPIRDSNSTLEEDTAAEEAIKGVDKTPVDESEDDERPEYTKEEQDLLQKANRLGDKISSSEESAYELDEPQDPLSFARIRRPRSMGITFVADVSKGAMKVQVEGARYKGFKVMVTGRTGKDTARNIYLRIPVLGSVTIDFDQTHFSVPVILSPETPESLPKLALELDVRMRGIPEYMMDFDDYPESAKLITVTLLNKSFISGKMATDSLTLFQSRFSITYSDPEASGILPLPVSPRTFDEEEKSLALLYRKNHVFSSGHGCSGDWQSDEESQIASVVVAEPIPYFEVPPITPDLVYPDGHPKAGQKLRIAMLPLAQAVEGWIEPLNELLDLYEKWIDNKEEESSNLSESHQNTARKHIESARLCLKRMQSGLELIKQSDEAAYAFRCTNEAILLQQIAGRFGQRAFTHDREKDQLFLKTQFARPSLDHDSAKDRYWRPFQIAFLLMSLPGIWDGENPDREIADLIWFPTGGGKTEAYLATSAFALLTRRMKDNDDDGTTVLMRYTLRLLTSQQFQRAAGLICALEHIRDREQHILGQKHYSIGIWVGGSTTPNKHAQSLEAYNAAKRLGFSAYKHVMLRCPWCGAQMGPLKHHKGHTVLGVNPTGTGQTRKVRVFCPDRDCDYHEALPVEVVDEGIYEKPPSLVIGTVDKFAILSWRPEARSLFGINEDGGREKSPPQLIIQDELHLITGPLGSIVGLYEGVIEELCTDRRNGKEIKAKLLAATATTRASTRQIRDLYARQKTAVFPPPGLDAGDSFFAAYERDNDGKIARGRLYLGILARNYSSTLTVSVRVFSALLAAASMIEDADERDPWHTLLVFYNSLRELGSNLTLFGADIPERLTDLRTRWSAKDQRRFLNVVKELTSRLSNSEIPRALESLETKAGDRGAVDACLASNIIEVGVDVPRLGLMSVAGQPKNSAQYIQATGRVGRSLPGLVCMLYDASKSRDLSHYEHFRDYHERLYAAVEPSSVTPFTSRVLERALHGAMLAWVRSLCPLAAQDTPLKFKETENEMRKEVLRFYTSLKKRIEMLYLGDSAGKDRAVEVFKDTMTKRVDQWETWIKSYAVVQWENRDKEPEEGEIPLLRFFGQACPKSWNEISWETPTSMRGVDTECSASICEIQENETASEEDNLTSLFN